MDAYLCHYPQNRSKFVPIYQDALKTKKLSYPLRAVMYVINLFN